TIILGSLAEVACAFNTAPAPAEPMHFKMSLREMDLITKSTTRLDGLRPLKRSVGRASTRDALHPSESAGWQRRTDPLDLPCLFRSWLFAHWIYLFTTSMNVGQAIGAARIGKNDRAIPAVQSSLFGVQALA